MLFSCQLVTAAYVCVSCNLSPACSLSPCEPQQNSVICLCNGSLQSPGAPCGHKIKVSWQHFVTHLTVFSVGWERAGNAKFGYKVNNNRWESQQSAGGVCFTDSQSSVSHDGGTHDTSLLRQHGSLVGLIFLTLVCSNLSYLGQLRQR